MSENKVTNTPNSTYGEIRTENGEKVLRFEREFAHPPEKVWRALVEPSELKGWFPSRIEGERKLGATLRFIFEGDKAPTLEGTILEFEPPRVLAYTWDIETLRWELHPTAEGCLLIFTSTLDPQYPVVGTATGWHVCFDMLEAQLDGAQVTWEEEARTEELRPIYAARLGVS